MQIKKAILTFTEDESGAVSLGIETVPKGDVKDMTTNLRKIIRIVCTSLAENVKAGKA